MTMNNKILTVSYGTFSCTLEGFDDSVSTMKEITEYFRNISAEDNVFGAEPMVADTEVLEQIAQQNQEGLIDARQEEGHIVLSATHDENVSDSSDDTSAAAALGAVVATATAASSEIVPSVPDDEVSAFFADGQKDVNTPEESSTSIADKLQGMRAATQHEETEVTDYLEDEHADDVADHVEQDLDDDDYNILADDAVEESEQHAVETDAELDRLEAEFDAEDAEVEAIDEAEMAHIEEEDDDAELAALLGSLREEDDHALSAEISESDLGEGDMSDIADFVQEEQSEQEEAQFTEDEAEAFFDEDQNDDEDILAGLMSEEPLDNEPLVLTGALPAEEVAAEEAEPEVAEPTSLEEEVAQDSEAKDESSEDGIKSAIAALSVERAKKRRTTSLLRNIDDADNPDVSRLMEMTEDQMGEPESATRRDAFAHLKAAVAAKKADDATSGALKGDELEGENDAYRADLADAVVPQAPEPKKPERKRSTMVKPRPAPLKLVAEHRIEGEEDKAAQAAKAAAQAEAEDTGTFDEFVAEMEVVELLDLMEAGAAYLTFVKGNKDFSRPQLMAMVRDVKQEELGREEGLRCFGKLLRNGKIRKVSGGRFQVSDKISFKPDARAAS